MNELLIYGDIGSDYWGESISAASVKAQLDQMPAGELTVRINSPGGSVFDGFAIYNLINQREGAVTVRIDGLAASAASVVAMAGDEIIMADNSMLMIHDPWTLIAGNSAEMRETADFLDKIRDSIVVTYQAQASELTAESIGEMMAAETWFNATEALEKGFITATESGGQTVSNIAKPWINGAPRADQVPDNQEAEIAWRIALNRRRLSIQD